MEFVGWFLVTALVVLSVGFVCYWSGRDTGSKQAYHWRKKFEEERNARILLRKQCDGLIHEIDSFFPTSVWRNGKWHPSDERYGVHPPARPTGHRDERKPVS